MRIPSRPHRLTRVLHVQPRDVEVRAWQAHVIKHPFGLGALYNASALKGDRRWNADGWDETDPPTITPSERAELVAGVVALDVDGQRCTASRLEREEYRGRAPHEQVPCYRCAPPLAGRCEALTTIVGERYRDVVDRLFASLDESVEVGRADAQARVATEMRRGGVDGTVLSVGRLADGRPGARLNDASGVRVELYLGGGGSLEWRTAYRRRLPGAADRANFLMDILERIPGRPLSDQVLVPRRWWERSL